MATSIASTGSSSSRGAMSSVRPGIKDVELAAQLGARFARTAVASRPSPPSLDPVRDAVRRQARATIGSRPPIRSSGSRTTSRRRTCRSSRGWRPRARRWRAIPALVDGRFLVAIAAHETTFHKREERVGRPGGRGTKPQAASPPRRGGRLRARTNCNVDNVEEEGLSGADGSGIELGTTRPAKNCRGLSISWPGRRPRAHSIRCEVRNHCWVCSGRGAGRSPAVTSAC